MLTDLLFSLPALIFLLFIPGYALVSALFPKKPLEWPEKFLSSFLFSITLNIITTLLLNSLLNIPVKLSILIIQNAAYSLLFTVIYFARLKRLPHLYLELYEYNVEKFLKTPAVIILVLSTVLLTYSIHQTYNYPFIGDEWQQIAEAKQIIDNSSLQGISQFEIGFHVLLAQIFTLTGQIPVTYSTYLPALFAGIAALGIFSFTKKATNSQHIALLSILFFAGIRSSTAIPGTWFLTPIVLGISYLFGILFFAISGFTEKNKTKLFIASFLILGLAFIDPVSALIPAIVFLLYLIIKRKEIKENAIGIGVFFLAAIIFVGLNILPAISTTTLPAKIITSAQYPITYYGIIPFILALIGAYYLIKKKISEVIMPWLGFIIMLMLLFLASGISALIPYANTLFYLFLILATLSACGLYAVLEAIGSRLKNNILMTLVSIILITGAAYATFLPYYDSSKSLSHAMEDRTYDAIKWLGNTKDGKNIVITRPEISPALQAIGGKNLTILNASSIEDNRQYFMSNCSEKKDILKKYNISFVLVSVEDKTDCEFLPWIYIQKGVYIYEVDKTLLD